MHISFSLKLGLLVTSLTALVSSAGIAYFYMHSKNLVREGIQNRLLNIGLVMSSQFTTDERKQISELSRILITESPELDKSVDMLRDGECDGVDVVIEKCPTISDDLRKTLMSQDDYLNLREKMRNVVLGTSLDVNSSKNNNYNNITYESLQDPSYMSYLQIPIPQSPSRDVLMVLANNDDASDPLGNLYASGDYGLFGVPFDNGKPSLSADWYFDEFCVERPCMTAVTPVFGESGEVIATIGVDYQLDSEWGALARLRRNCYTVVSIIVTISIILSVSLATMVNVPIRRLVAGAQAMQTRTIKNKIKTGTRDEFGYLAAILNDMWKEISDYSNGLEKLVAERTNELESANDAVLELNKKLEKENQSLGSELDIAHELQESIMPTESQCSNVKGFELAVDCERCPQVAGNYIDIIESEEESVVAIGDISEQGLETGVFLLNMRSIIRSIFASSKTLTYILNRANSLAIEYLKTIKSEKIMSLSLLSLSKQGDVQLTGQNEDVLIVRESGQVEVLDSVGLGFPLGLLDDISPYTTSLGVKLKGKDTLVLYSSGVTEARNKDGEFFGVDRLSNVVSKNLNCSVEDIRKHYKTSMTEFTSGTEVMDDRSLVLVRRAA